MDNRQSASEFLREIYYCAPKDFFQKIDAMQKGLGFILIYLYEVSGEVSSGDLARRLGVSTARIAALLKKLEGKELIERCSSPADARRTIVKMTNKGTLYIEEMREQMLAKAELLFEKVGREDLKTFISICKKISAVLDEENG